MQSRTSAPVTPMLKKLSLPTISLVNCSTRLDPMPMTWGASATSWANSWTTSRSSIWSKLVTS